MHVKAVGGDEVRLEGTKRIVVSEKQDQNTVNLVQLLEKEGHRVFKAVTVNQTARWVEAEEPDLVIVSLQPSSFYPLEIIGSLKDSARTRNVPIGMIGDLDEHREQAMTCLEMGADFFFGTLDREGLLMASIKSALRMRQQMNELKRLSITDELTGLYNRRFFLRRLDEEIARAERYGISLVCLVIDIDKFKSINDTYGHHMGDWVLKEISGIFLENIRKSDIMSRYGGDEFTILLSHNSIRGASILAEYLRKAVEAHSFEKDGTSIKTTISLGLSRYPDDNLSHSAHDLIKHADLALYDAKSRGRNMFRIYGDGSYSNAIGTYQAEQD